jgi:hypothetical protein
MRTTFRLVLGETYEIGPILISIGKICGTVFQLIVKSPPEVNTVRYKAWHRVFGKLGNGAFKPQGEPQRFKNRGPKLAPKLDRFTCRRGRALVVDQDILLSVLGICRSGVKLRIWQDDQEGG